MRCSALFFLLVIFYVNGSYAIYLTNTSHVRTSNNPAVWTEEGIWGSVLEEWALGDSNHRQSKVMQIPISEHVYIFQDRIDSDIAKESKINVGKIVSSPNNSYRPSAFQNPPPRQISETDLYLLNAIEKLVYKADFMEKRLRRVEEMLYYVMAGNRVDIGYMERSSQSVFQPYSYLTFDPHVGTRTLANELGICRTTVENILKDHKFLRSRLILFHYNRMHPYHIVLHQALRAEDFDRRLNYFYWLLNMMAENPDILSCILWTDEATFTSNGGVNLHNMHYWSRTNPHWMQEVQHQGRWSVNVWCGILGEPCIENFTRVGQYCYIFANMAGREYDWKVASKHCKKLGAVLAEMETIEENQDVIAYIQSNVHLKGKDFWVGGLNPGLLWIWSNSARPILAPGSQNNNNNKDNPSAAIQGEGRCLKLAYNPALRFYAYKGTDCSVRYSYICEAPETTSSNEIQRIGRSRNIFRELETK